MVHALLGPIVSVLPLSLGSYALVAVGGPKWIYLLAALWFAWRAYRSFRNSTFIYKAIAKRQPWRESYYESLYHQGSSRAEAYRVSSWAWLHDPLMFLMATACCFLMIVGYVSPPRPDAAPLAPCVTHRR